MAFVFVSRSIYGIGLVLFASAALSAQDAREPNELEPGVLVAAEALLASPVRTATGDVAAEVAELMIDPDSGSIRFVIITTNDGRRVAIPWNQLTIRNDGSVVVSANEDELGRAQEFPERPRPRSETTPDPSPEATVVITPAGRDAESRVAYAPTRDPSFDPATVASFQGLVVGTVTAPIDGGTDEVVALVDVGEPDEVRAHLGPAWFVRELGIDLDPEDGISFSGSVIEIEDERIVLVSRVTHRDRTFILREKDGAPLWTRARP